MGITERKEREKLEMRQLIIKGAMDMFLEEGFDKTTIRKIAQRIEYSPATIYLYFKNKDELFYAVHEEAFQIFRDYLYHVGKDIADPMDRLHMMGKAYINFAYENQELYDLMFILRAPMQSLVECGTDEWDEGHKAYDLLKRTVQECINNGYFPYKDVDHISFMIFSSMHGMTSLAIRERWKMYPEEAIPSMMEESMHLVMDMLRK
ncbi:MAG: TetR/AcrR family transcriptional regulator [Bacteroidota bacterium]